jgi:hypothetical protein
MFSFGMIAVIFLQHLYFKGFG